MERAGKEKWGKHVKRCDEKRDDITYMSMVDGVIESCRAELGKIKGK